MKRIFLVSLLILSFTVVGCSQTTPWRKATVTTFELVGAGMESTKDVATSLRNSGTITEAQLNNIKVVYGKAREAYAKAGAALKLAGRVASTAEQNAQLAEYTKFLAEFGKLAQEVYDMIKGFRKTSLLEVQEWIIGGTI